MVNLVVAMYLDLSDYIKCSGKINLADGVISRIRPACNFWSCSYMYLAVSRVCILYNIILKVQDNPFKLQVHTCHNLPLHTCAHQGSS